MDLYEYQAKDLFAAHGVPVLPGEVAETAEQARAAAATYDRTVVPLARALDRYRMPFGQSVFAVARVPE